MPILMFLNNSNHRLEYISKTIWLLDFWRRNGRICICRCVSHDNYGGWYYLEFHVEKKSGRESVWQKLIVGKPLQNTYHNGLSMRVCLEILCDAGGKYLQVGPLQPSSACLSPDRRVPTPPSVVLREWSPFA